MIYKEGDMVIQISSGDRYEIEYVFENFGGYVMINMKDKMRKYYNNFDVVNGVYTLEEMRLKKLERIIK